MKRIVFFMGLAVVWAGCSNNTASNGGSNDSGSYGGPHAGHITAESPASVETTSATGRNMTDLMHGNMQQMQAVASIGNPDRDFAALMRIHHKGALEMAQLQIAQGQDEELKTFSKNIIGAQQGEIATFDSLLAHLNDQGNNRSFYDKSMAQMKAMHMAMDSSASVDKQFVQMMIPHHQGAIDMSKTYLQSGATHPQLKSMANSIISSQQKEIGQLQAWLKQHP